MPSIKVLNISLVLLCIFTTAFVCTFLAITSSEKALDDTKKSRDTSTASCFAVGAESVTNRTKDYLDLLMSSTVEFLSEFTKSHRSVAQSLAREIMAEPWDTIKMWEWHRKPRYFHTFNVTKDNGNTGIGVVLRNNLVLINYENLSTLTNSPSGYHSLKVTMNYGDDNPEGGPHRSFRASSDQGYPIGVTNPLTDVNWIDNATYPCSYDAVPTMGAAPDQPCVSPGWGTPNATALFLVSTMIPLGGTLWTYPLPVGDDPGNPAGIYFTINCMTSIQHNNTFSGVVSSSADLRHITNYLSSLQISGPVDGYPSRGRVFITLRSSFLDHTKEQAGRMIGASHGSTVSAPGPNMQSLYPIESSDRIISSVGRQVSNELIEKLAATHELTVLNVSTALAPEGEEFYYRVGRLYDEYGVDWYVHLVIDRAYILGSIDRKVEETHERLAEAESQVDDNLQDAQTVLYVSVVAVAVSLTILSAMFVLRIIEPLVVLEREMAAVAVMKLEAVDMNQSLSALREVRLMQVSFLQMIRNLVEYRNYMPASVLQQDTESDNDDDSVHEVLSGEHTQHSEASYEHNFVRVSTTGITRPVMSLHNDVRVKRVTLMVCNMVGFLHVKDILSMQSKISSYLTVGLHHLKTSRGIPDSFSGDRLYASWNGVRLSSSHRTAAYNCAMDMHTDKNISCKLSIGLVSGDVKCGNMGCEGMKKYSYIGSLSSWVHVVERIGRSMECEVAIDAVVNEEVCNKAYTRMLQHVVFRKHSQGVLRVYEAMRQKHVVNEEWMYQLEESQNKDPNKAYNSSYELFMEGRVEEAVKVLGNEDDGSKVMQIYRERLVRAEQNPEACEPLGKRDPLYN